MTIKIFQVGIGKQNFPSKLLQLRTLAMFSRWRRMTLSLSLFFSSTFNNVNLADVMLLSSGSGIMLKDELEDYVAEPWIQ